MPRRSSARFIEPQFNLEQQQESTLHQNYAVLRKQWKWAAFSQFFFTFAPLFAMNDVSINDVEQDLINETTNVLPRIIIRMLYTLSYDRKVSLNNWQTALRKQYFKRDPAANPIGPEPPRPDQHEVERHDTPSKHEDDPDADHKEPEENHEEGQGSQQGEGVGQPSEKDSTTSPQNVTRASSVAASHQHDSDQGESLDWTKLPMLTKLESIHTLMEWQFQNPTRLRQVMKDDDEAALWRIEPVGYDSKRNAYWFIAGSQLWIQREPPKPPKKTAAKRKRAPQAAKDEPASKPAAKRARTKATPAASKAKEEPPTPSGRSARAAKAQAKLKLNAQAKELAELNRQAALSTRPRRGAAASSSKAPPPKPTGTRVSARLRGAQDDEWQEIPDEWLEESSAKDKGRRKGKPAKTGLEDDAVSSISDLTELSDEEEGSTHEDPKEESAKEEEPEPPKPEVEEPKAPELPSDFIEWEMICSTLFEWEHIAEQFANATYYTEKALYKLLTQQIVPDVVHELKEIEKRRHLEEALSHRKRSSRLAIRESEKEEARLAAKRKAEEDEKLGRARRLEARQQKEEAERIKKEQAREQRRKDREAREASRHASVSTQDPVQPAAAATPPPEPKPNGKAATEAKPPAKRPRQKAKRDDWELDCEICHQRGINLDDGTPLMSCGRCSKWQHIRCHDRADQVAGRPRRNWDVVDFYCLKCRGVMAQQPSQPQPQRNGYAAYGQHAVPMHHAIPPMQVPNHSYHHPSLRDVVHNGYAQHSRYGDAQMYSQPPPPAMHMQSGSHSYGQPPRQTLTFSHYQPANQAFSPSAHSRGYPDTMRPYQGTGYVESAMSANKVPISNQWNVSTPVQPSGPYMPPTAHVPPLTTPPHLENGVGHQPPVSHYRTSAEYANNNHQAPINGNAETSSSFLRYSSQHAGHNNHSAVAAGPAPVPVSVATPPVTQFRHHPSSYPSQQLGR